MPPMEKKINAKTAKEIAERRKEEPLRALCVLLLPFFSPSVRVFVPSRFRDYLLFLLGVSVPLW